MPSWWKKFSWEWLFDNIAERSPTFVKVMVVTGKSFLYYHGMTRAASLTYTTLTGLSFTAEAEYTCAGYKDPVGNLRLSLSIVYAF